VAVLVLRSGGDPIVPDPPLILVLPEDGKLNRWRTHIMDLDEVYDWLAGAPEGGLDLLSRLCRIGARPARDIQLRRPEELWHDVRLLRAPPRHLFGGTIAGRRVEHFATFLDHHVHDVAEGCDVVGTGDLREG